MPSRDGRKFVARVADLGDAELHCHAFGHAWAPKVHEQRHDSQEDRIFWVQELRCLRCPKVRTDVVDSHTFVKTGRSHYTEPDRFRVLEPVLRGRADYRREAIQRSVARQRAGGRAQRFQVL